MIVMVKNKKSFEETREEGIKIAKSKLSPADKHDSIWLLWRDYYERKWCE